MRVSGNQMTLGELIATLKRKNQTARVTFGFDGQAPVRVDSYRGYYEDLAIGYERKCVSVADVLKMLEAANGDTFTGWKGGEFTMRDDTAIWVANSGECHGVAVVDVVEARGMIWLKTELID